MIHQFNVRKIILLILIICMSVISTGCAKTVTQKYAAGTEITFAITFKTAPSFTNYNYYLIFGDSRFNLNSNLSSNYFFIPGETYNVTSLDTVTGGGGLESVYNNYYSSWAGAITLKSEDITLTNGPFSNTTSTDTEHYNYTSSLVSIDNYKVNEATISFTIPVSDLKLSGNTLYYSFVTTKGDNVNNTQDLVSDIQSIDLIANSPPKTGLNDTSLFSADNSAKIVSWTVSVQ